MRFIIYGATRLGYYVQGEGFESWTSRKAAATRFATQEEAASVLARMDFWEYATIKAVR